MSYSHLNRVYTTVMSMFLRCLYYACGGRCPICGTSFTSLYLFRRHVHHAHREVYNSVLARVRMLIRSGVDMTRILKSMLTPLVETARVVNIDLVRLLESVTIGEVYRECRREVKNIFNMLKISGKYREGVEKSVEVVEGSGRR